MWNIHMDIMSLWASCHRIMIRQRSQLTGHKSDFQELTSKLFVISMWDLQEVKV